jgi:hypothetical protein
LSDSGGNLFADESGIAWLSWVEYLNDSADALMYDMPEGDIWSARKETACGSDWFITGAALIRN